MDISVKKLGHVIFCLSVDILDKVLLKGSEKIAKHISPIAGFMQDGFSSANSDFMAIAAMVLKYMANNIDLDKAFLRDCLKKMLKSDILNNYVCLRTVIDIVSSQENFFFDEKMENLLSAKIERLDVDDKRKIENKLLDVNIVKHEAMDAQDSEIKTEEHIIKTESQLDNKSAKQMSQSTLVDDIIGNCCIDWTALDMENKINELFSTYVLTWHNTNNSNIDVKLALEIIAMIRGKPKGIQINYKHGGALSYLCVALMSPSAEVRRSSKKLITKLIVDWPSMSVVAGIKKSVLVNDHNSLTFGDVGKTLLTEIDAICDDKASLTIRKVALAMINKHTLPLVPSLTNIWSIFLQGICSTNKLTILIKELAMSALSVIKESFIDLQDKDQNTILDAITLGLTGNHEILNKVTDTLTKVHLSLANFQYLFRDITGLNTKVQKKKLKKFDSKSVEPSDGCIQGDGKFKVLVALGALSHVSTLSASDHIHLIHPLFIIIEKVLKNTTKDTNKDDMIYLLTNLMSAMLTILPSDESGLDIETKDFLTPKISIEDITKCLYIFNNVNLHNLILMVIQKFAKLELGLEQFPLIFFMNWLGKNIVPRDDQHSMSILNSVLELILPLSIKMRRKSEDASNDNVKIIASFVKDCVGLPKHRSLLLYHILIKNLSSDGLDASSVLWIQLIFMLLNKSSTDHQSPSSAGNESLILPLMKKFSKEEQLQSMKKVIGFLAKFINDPSKKRKFFQESESNSPMQKKRKVTSNGGVKAEKLELNTNKGENEFASLKEHLMTTDKNLNCASLMETMLTYFLIQLKESHFDMSDVTSEMLTDLISSLFSYMKIISNTSQALIDSKCKNKITVMIREIIESVGASLSRNSYLDLIVDLAKHDYDESVKMKSLELLSNKLALMAKDRNCGHLDTELLRIATEILSMCKDTVSSDNLSVFWEYSVSCATSLVALGFLNQNEVKQLCDQIYISLLNKVDSGLASMTPDKVVLLNSYLQKYVTGDNGNDLSNVFKSALNVIENCSSKQQFNNGALESALSLIHSILARTDSESIGWAMFERLLSDIYELTSQEFQVRKMSNASLIYQKNIRIRLSKMRDTEALMRTCIRLIDAGKEKKNLTFISGSISLFGCHLVILYKFGKQWNMEDQNSGDLWDIVFRLLSIWEVCDMSEKTEEMQVCEEISLKALSQMCQLFDHDQAMLAKLMTWGQQCDSAVTPATYLKRNAIIYRLLHHITLKSKNPEKAMDFLNQSNAIVFASALLKHLASDRDSKKKKKKIVESEFVIGFSKEQLTSECPKECMDLVRSICSALHGHLAAEFKINMNLVVNDETTALITNVCSTLTSMDTYVTSKEDFLVTSDKYVIPVIVQLVLNSFNDDTLLTPLCMALCKYFRELSSNVHLAILKVLSNVKDAIGVAFDSNIRDKVSSFLDDCKMHDDETISNMAGDI